MQAPPKFHRGEQVSTLLQIADVCSVFRSHTGQDFASVPHGPLTHNAIALDSPSFQAWLVNCFVDAKTTAPTANALNTALLTLHAKTQFGANPDAVTGRRVIGIPDRIILDLATPAGDCLEINAQGWQPPDGLTYAFERPTGAGALPAPVRVPDPESLDRLAALLNIPSGVDRARTLTWLTSALRPEGPYPILILRGSSGAGKSTAARLLRTVLDPVQTPLEALPATPHQLQQAASHQRILAFDDVDRIPPAVLSSLAKIADETAPVILVLSSNFTGELPQQIARRGLLIQLTQLKPQRTVHSLRREFEAIHPLALGALCTAASTALRHFDSLAESTYPRLADATAWTLAAASALPLTAAQILEALANTPAVLINAAVFVAKKHKTPSRSAASSAEPAPRNTPKPSTLSDARPPATPAGG